jgi:2-phospho-L-lactate guanylyltransferase
MLQSLPMTGSMTDSARFSWTVLLPVKVLARAKSRLAVLAGPRREELALALALDTVSAVVACAEVARVVVITSDGAASRELAALGAHVIRDLTDNGGPDGGLGAASGNLDALGVQDRLNAALTQGAEVAARRWPGTGLAALTADLPALRPEELAAALRAAALVPAAGRGEDGRVASERAVHPQAMDGQLAQGAGAARGTQGTGSAFVADAAGVGTTLYAAVPGTRFRPLYGGASRARHAASGAVELGLAGVPGLRRDVDTSADLRAALALGSGPRTCALAAVLLANA